MQGNGSAGRSQQVKASWKGFYNAYLTKRDKAAIKQMVAADRSLLDVLLELADHGYKLSIVFSPEGNFYTATAYAGRAGHINAGYSSSVRHADLETAIYGVFFVLEEKHSWGAWPVDGESDNPYDW